MKRRRVYRGVSAPHPSTYADPQSQTMLRYLYAVFGPLPIVKARNPQATTRHTLEQPTPGTHHQNGTKP